MMNGFEHIEIPEIELVCHRSPESIFRQHWAFGDESVTLDEILQGTAGGVDGDGNEVDEIPMSEMFDAVKANDFWAFSDCPNRVIHLWLRTPIDEGHLSVLLGHEVGHVLEHHAIPNPTAEIEDEMKADRYGIAAVIVSSLVNDSRRAFSGLVD